MRRLFCILLLICLPLQSFSMQVGGMQVFAGDSLEHALEHAQEIEHHHHEEDGSVHYDDSQESMEHTQEHAAASAQCLLDTQCLPLEPRRLLTKIAPAFQSTIPNPDLEDPQRPPVFAPGIAAGG